MSRGLGDVYKRQLKMHGLNQIVRMNKEQEEFIAHVLSTPTPDVNLLQVWHDWKAGQTQQQTKEIA